MESVVELRLGVDLRQSDSYGKFMEKLGWITKKIPNSKAQIFFKKIGPLTMAKMRRPGPDTPWEEIVRMIKKEKVLACQVDPEVDDPQTLKKWGFSKNRSQILGTKTLLVDLRPSEEKILAGFKQETRYKLKKVQDSGFKIQLNDFDNFYEILKAGYKEIDVWCPPIDQYQSLIECFSDQAFCLNIDGVSGCLVLIHNQVAEYYYAASTAAGKENNLPYLVVWEAMKEAKKRGAVVWDFNGFFDTRYPDKRWKGFSFFKSRFGGVELEFAGTYTRWSLFNL